MVVTPNFPSEYCTKEQKETFKSTVLRVRFFYDYFYSKQFKPRAKFLFPMHLNPVSDIYHGQLK